MHTVANGWIYISGAKAINSWQKCTRLSSDSRDILHLEYHGLSLTDGTSVVRGLSVERKELSPASHTAPKTEVCQHSGWMPRYLLWRREGGTARDLLLITSTQSGGHGQLEQVSQRHSPLSWYLSDTTGSSLASVVFGACDKVALSSWTSSSKRRPTNRRRRHCYDRQDAFAVNNTE